MVASPVCDLRCTGEPTQLSSLISKLRYLTLSNNENTGEHQPFPADHNRVSPVSRFVEPLYQSRFWIRLFAGCLVFYGALLTVTGIGVLVAWIPMWIGVLLLLANKAIVTAYKKNDERALLQVTSRLKTIFSILGFASVALIVSSIYLLKYALDKSYF